MITDEPQAVPYLPQTPAGIFEHWCTHPQDYQSEDRAVRQAKLLSGQHAGVIAWSREANVDIGEYGEPVTLFQAGDIPDME